MRAGIPRTSVCSGMPALSIFILIFALELRKISFQMINHLIKIGLIEVQTGGNQWNTSRLYLTPAGQEVASHVESINKTMKKLYESIPEEINEDSE